MHHRVRNVLPGLFFFVLLSLIFLTSCNYRPVRRPDPPPSTAGPAAAQETPEQTATQPPSRLFTICMAQEPSSLFLYGDGSAAARSIRQAIYDGPFDLVNFQYQPVILESTPSAAGGLAFEPQAVQPGDLVVDAAGNLSKLADGLQILPAGCHSGECATPFSAQAPVQMDQMVVRFRLRPGLTWSDGQSLTTDASVYSFEVARSLYPRVRAELIDRTAAYTAVDEQTIEWRGVPGYVSPGYPTNFFTPLPRHAWGSMSGADLLAADASNRKPLGWGPYVIDEWTPGDHISLSRNPAYFRLAEGLPVFEKLVFRFIPDPNQALSALLVGECDYLDETNHLETQAQQLSELKEGGKLAVFSQPGAAWEHLDFGITSYPLPDAGGPLPFFQAKETRQGVALCIDRQAFAAQLFFGQSQAPDSYIPADHPLFNPNIRRYTFNPAEAGKLLDAAGWLDADANPATPRVSQGVAGIPDGTAFEVTLLTTDETEKQSAAQAMQASLAQCGIKLNLSALPVEMVFAAGPEGAIFGRNFSLAQFGWVSSAEPPCRLFSSAEIPGPYPEFPRGWGGANASGYSNPEFDRQCQAAAQALPDSPERLAAHQAAQAIFAEDLPALPLYARPRLVATRPDFCGVTLDSSSDVALWNLENFNYGQACGQ